MQGGEAICGPFAYDPGGAGPILESRIDKYMRLVCERYAVDYGIGTLNGNFLLAAVLAAFELKSKMRASIIMPTGSVDENALADACWGYNGRSNYHTPTGEWNEVEKSWKYSPYVSNDPAHGIQLRIKGTIPDPNEPDGRKHIDIMDERPGAIIVYREIVMRELDIEVA